MNPQFLADLWAKVYVAAIRAGKVGWAAEEYADKAVAQLKRRYAEGVFSG